MIFIKLLAFIVIVVIVSVDCQYDPHFVNNRSVIVHLFEWKFKDIAKECEQYLGPNGFGGVQTSPINEYLVSEKRTWMERYQPISYQIKSRSGDETQFVNMVRRCNDVGVRVYVDVVINHMASGAEIITGTAGNEANPANREFGAVPYGPEDFHEECELSNYQDPFEVRNCALNSLPDLNHEQDNVKEKISEFLNRLIGMGVAGFRVDACKHMWPHDLEIIYGNLQDLNVNHGFEDGAKAFIYQEVIDLGGEAISKLEYNGLGVVTEFQYGNDLGQAFHKTEGKNLHSLLGMGTKTGLLPSSDALVFVDNHENQRADGSVIISYKEPKLYIMATAFLLAYPYGIARIMSSYEFEDRDEGPPLDKRENILSPNMSCDGQCNNGWICEQRWPTIKSMVQFRRIVEGTKLENWSDDGYNQMTFCRGNKGFIAFNAEHGVGFNATVNTCLPVGTYCDIISGRVEDYECTGVTVVVDENSKANVVIPHDDPNGVIAIHVEEKVD